MSRRRRLLIVEDDLIMRELICAMLDDRPYDLEYVDNGSDAVKIVAAGGIDLVLMDCKMPVMDGFEASTLIRETNDVVPIIGFSGSPDREKSINAGMNDVLAKPNDVRRLADVVDSYLASSDG